MKLEQQVVSLEMAKKLKELGVKRESLFMWFHQGGNFSPELKSCREFLQQGEIRLLSSSFGGIKNMDFFYPAFTVAELGEMLPGNDGSHYFVSQKGLMGNLWFCTRKGMIDNSVEYQTESETEADARAKMLIYLLENKFITL